MKKITGVKSGYFLTFFIAGTEGNGKENKPDGQDNELKNIIAALQNFVEERPGIKIYPAQGVSRSIEIKGEASISPDEWDTIKTEVQRIIGYREKVAA